MSAGPADRGSVTAELAVALPAVGLVLATCVWGLGVAAEQVRLQDRAGLAARAAARGEPGGEGVLRRDGDLVCATLSETFGGVALDARSCALP